MKLARSIVRPFFEIYMYIYGSRIVASKLENLSVDCNKDEEKLVELVFNFEYKQKFRKSWIVSLKPLQVKSEITDLCKFVHESNPKKMVEIGSASGGTLFLFSHVANPDKIISIDLPAGSFGGGYPFWKIPLFRSLAKKNVIQLISSNSHQKETLEKVKTLLKDSEIDFLFIDGDHTYQGVKQDFQMYSPLVRKGGIVAFHDIVKHDPSSGCEVEKFWSEIKSSYKHIEFIENQNQKWAGIGVLFL